MEVVIFMGAPASGKSEFYKQYFYKSHIRLNLDMLHTRHREKILYEACLTAKQPVVIDNTNPQCSDRQRYMALAKENKFSVIGYFFSSVIQDCVKRNRGRMGKERIPDAAVASIYNKLELPQYQEGFDQLYYVRISENNTFLIEEYRDEV